MNKWIETQQLISKENKDWQQAKDILLGRLDLVKKESVSLKDKNKEAQNSIKEANEKKKELEQENDELKKTQDQLVQSIIALEEQIKILFKQMPDPVKERLLALYERIPQDATKTRVSAAERFQNIFGILSELNKANSEISVSYEIHNLADGKPAEVQVLYVGLAQAYYVSASGEVGVGHPRENGWQWSASETNPRHVLAALDMLQGKQTPAFVPLWVKIK